MYSQYDRNGERKWLTDTEREAFLESAMPWIPEKVSSYCLVLGFTGARPTEVRELVPRRFDFETDDIIFRCLKKKKKKDGSPAPIVHRAVPVPRWLLELLDQRHDLRRAQQDPVLRDQRIWPWCRTTAWSHVKEVMKAAGIIGGWGTGKGLRHTYGRTCRVNGIELEDIQGLLGHEDIKTTTVYVNSMGLLQRESLDDMWDRIALHRKMERLNTLR